MRGPSIRRGALSAAFALVLVGCGPARGSQRGEDGGVAPGAELAMGADHSAHGPRDGDDGSIAGLPSAAPSPSSIYHHDARWADQSGDSIRLADLGGRVQLVAMVYTHCTFACPRILADLKRIEGLLEAEELAGVGFVLVSLDPERDHPERLAEFGEAAALDEKRWTLLSGADQDIRVLSALLGVTWRKRADGEFEHSNQIAVLDPAGVVVHREIGLGVDPLAVLDAVRSGPEESAR